MSLNALFLVGVYPLWRLVRANRRTSLRYAAYWTVVAWAGWGLLICATSFESESQSRLDPFRFLALCLTAGAGVAVLGARRPHAGAWNYVVLGMLAVLLLPLAEHRLLGTPLLSGLRAWFLGGALLLAVVNYMPTRFGPAAVLVGIGCGDALVMLAAPDGYLPYRLVDPPLICLTLAPWVAFFRRFSHSTSTFDALWLDFRDRFSLLWGLRIREQFNASVKNSGLPVRLTWAGLKPLSGSLHPEDRQTCAALETLRALLKRFMPGG